MGSKASPFIRGVWWLRWWCWWSGHAWCRRTAASLYREKNVVHCHVCGQVEATDDHPSRAAGET